MDRITPDPTELLPQPYHRPIWEEAAAVAARNPDAVAIRHSGRDYRYDELLRTSSQWASAIAHGNAQPGEVVAVTGRRSFELIAAMLGVLQTRCVLLTLDPNLPKDRRRTMLEVSGAKRLIVAGEGVDASEFAGLCEVLTSGIESENTRKTEPPRPEDAAYIFFTSGSTGVPKAVLGRHAGLAHFLAWQRSTFGVGPGDRASQLTALSFDVILRDVFLALTSGATLCIPPEQAALDPREIVRWLAEEEITTIHVVPSLGRLWLSESAGHNLLPALRRVFFAGEPLLDVLVDSWRRTFSGTCEVVNLYGPTETTLAKCFFRVPNPPEPGIQPVGWTQPQTQALVLNNDRRLCAVDEVGEIAIRTPFRTLGYWNNPEANAKAFIRNPYRDDADDLVYLTGDAGRYRPDGMLQILGRLDNQVKIRGVRIEPGEIESVLAKHASIRENVVVGRPTPDGDKELVAYYSLRHEAAATSVEDLRTHLRATLPEVMVPARFVLLERLPLLPNGKVDRRSLPVPPAQDDSQTTAVVDESCDEVERVLVAAWRTILNRLDLGLDADFFDAGGHSLLAARLVKAIETESGRTCTLAMLFRNRTPRKLAAELRAGGADATEAAAIALQPEGQGTPFFCICGVHLYQQLADALGKSAPVFAIFLPVEQEILSGKRPLKDAPSVDEMAAEYVAAIRKCRPEGPYRLIGASFGGVLAFEIAHQLRRAGSVVSQVVMLDSMLPRALRRDWKRTVRRAVSDSMKRVKRLLRRKPTSASENQRLAELRQKIYKAATARYRPQSLVGEVVLIRAHDKSFFDSDIADATYGWSALAPNLRVADVQGDHLGILTGSEVAATARAILGA